MTDSAGAEVRLEVSNKRPRGTGSVYRQKGSANWWIQYYRNGRVYRQSAATAKRRIAEKLLQQKLGAIATHSFIEPRFEKTLVKELAEDMLRDYAINGRKSLADVQTRWTKHLSKEFGQLRASNIGNDELKGYIAQRQNEGASNATINRELAALKRMFSLGVEAKKVYSVIPKFPHLEERNVRKGFVEDSQYEELARASSAEGLWLRAMFEVAYNFGWRVSELLNLRVRQVDLSAQTIRLEPGETKNDEARTVVMTGLVSALIQQCITRKQPEDYVFTREDGKPVRDFRTAWAKVCCTAKLGEMVCPNCRKPVGDDRKCCHCSREWKRNELKYIGLIFHDLRRTAVRNMVRSGIPERVAMTISGHKTRSVFDRYNIVNEGDLKEAARKLEIAKKAREEQRAPGQYGYSSDIVEPTQRAVASMTKFH